MRLGWLLAMRRSIGRGRDRVDRAAMRVVSVEQRAQQCRLRGGRVLVFVEEHMRIAFAVGRSDGRESGDKLECRDG